MSRRLSVIHVVRAFQTGGLETLVLELCARTDAVDAAVVAVLPGDGLETLPAYASVPTATLTDGRRGWLRSVKTLARYFRERRPDVVHTHNFQAHWLGAPGARRAGVPAVITTKHGSSHPRLWRSRWLAGRVFRLADVVVAVSEESRQGFLGAYTMPPERVRVILNGVDTDRFRPPEGDREAARERVLGLTGRPLLGTVSRLVGYKGIATLLNTFAAVAAQLPEARLVIAGDGEDRAALEAQARRLGLAPRVHFLGNRRDVDVLYSLLDIFVLPSYTEGISLTMLEAAATALPIVAAEVGGNPEIVGDGVSGRLVAPRDVGALADAILATWADPAAAAAMGAAARERIVEHFSLRRMAADYAALYDEVLARKRGGAEATP